MKTRTLQVSQSMSHIAAVVLIGLASDAHEQLAEGGIEIVFEDEGGGDEDDSSRGGLGLCGWVGFCGFQEGGDTGFDDVVGA